MEVGEPFRHLRHEAEQGREAWDGCLVSKSWISKCHTSEVYKTAHEEMRSDRGLPEGGIVKHGRGGP